MYHSIRQYQHSTPSPSPFVTAGNPIKVTDSLLIILRIIQSTVSQCAIRATMVVFVGLLTVKHQFTFRQNLVMLVTAKSQRCKIPKCLYISLFRAGLFSIRNFRYQYTISIIPILIGLAIREKNQSTVRSEKYCLQKFLN